LGRDTYAPSASVAFLCSRASVRVSSPGAIVSVTVSRSIVSDQPRSSSSRKSSANLRPISFASAKSRRLTDSHTSPIALTCMITIS
jgi:hypothetical protein